MFEHEPQPPDSLLKFLGDLYSTRSTAGLLYTNDAHVLIDIVLRQLTDLSPGDKVRTFPFLEVYLFHEICEHDLISITTPVHKILV